MDVLSPKTGSSDAVDKDYVDGFWKNGGGFGGKMTVDTVAPSGPTVGDVWVDGTDGAIKIWDSSGWVRLIPVPKLCDLLRSTNKTIPTSSWTAIDFTETDLEDVDGMHDPSTNPTRVTAVEAGWYELTGGLTWTPNTTGARGAAFRINNTGPFYAQDTGRAVAAVGIAHSINQGVRLGVGDYVEMFAFQSSGADLAITSNSGVTPVMMTVKQVMGL